MIGDPFEELRVALACCDEWPTDGGRRNVVEAARRFVQAVEHRAAVIEEMRQWQWPPQQALSELFGGQS